MPRFIAFIASLLFAPLVAAQSFVDVTPAVRFGAEFSWTDQTFVDKTDAKDYRGQFSAFFLF